MILTFLAWLILSEPEVPVEVISNVPSKNRTKHIFLNRMNASELENGKWLIFVEEVSLDEGKLRGYEKGYNTAFLRINDRSTAKIASMLQVRGIGEVIRLENGLSESCFGTRKTKSENDWVEQMDYFIYFSVHKIKDRLLNDLGTTETALDLSFWILDLIFKQLPTFFAVAQ